LGTVTATTLAATSSPRVAIASLRATPSTLGSRPTYIEVRATVSHGTTCQLVLLSKESFPVIYSHDPKSCANGRYSAHIFVSPKPSTKKRVLSFGLTARNKTSSFVAHFHVAIAPTPLKARGAPATKTRPGSTARCTPLAGTFTITVCGNQFVNQAGQDVVLRGVNTEGTQYDCAQSGAGFFDDPTMSPGNYATNITALKAWGVNVVRVNLNEECWLGINGVPSTTSEDVGAPPAGDTYDAYQNAYMNAIGGYVSALNAAGIYAELDLHLNAPGDELISDSGNMDAQNPLPEANSDLFWKSVASYFNDNHAVIFGVFNEPFPPNAEANGDTTTGWDCTLNGCTVPDYTDVNSSQYDSDIPSSTYAGEGMAQMISDIRQYNTTAPLLVGGPDFAGDVDDWLATYYPGGKSIDPDNKLAASVHIYFPSGNSPCSLTDNVSTACPTTSSGAMTNDQVTTVAATAPVVLDEIGDFNCSNSDMFPFLQSVDAEDASAHLNIGYVGWAWTTYSCDPNLITDWTTGAPSTMGEAEYCELLDIGAAPSSNSLFTPSSYCSGDVPDATPAS